MKKSITPAQRIRCQRGFSILEILIATVLISSLVASGLYYANVGDKAATVDIAASKAAVAVRFPEAVMTVYAQKQTLLNTSNADLISTGSVQANRPVTWGVVTSGPNVPKASELSVTLTFDKSSIAKAMETYLTSNLDAMLVSRAVVDATDNKVLTVTYGLN